MQFHQLTRGYVIRNIVYPKIVSSIIKRFLDYGGGYGGCLPD